jgi:hypothetical protein
LDDRDLIAATLSRLVRTVDRLSQRAFLFLRAFVVGDQLLEAARGEQWNEKCR